MVIWLPCLLALFVTLVGVSNLWLARVELENAVESAALAAVKQWGDAGGGDTLVPRQTGVEYAQANGVRGNPLAIGTNYDAAALPNQNAECDVAMTPPTANLIFGAIDDDDPDNVIFNAGIAPSCVLGTVLFDVSAERDLEADNAWGISFYNTASTPPALRITRVIIDLRGSGGTGSFTGPAVITDNSPQPAVIDNSGNSQPDLVGFTDPDDQIDFSYPAPGQLQIDFLPDNDPPLVDDGFAPGDRFRFGQDTTDVRSGNSQNDGDAIGRVGTTVTVFFSLGGIPLPPLTGVVGTYVDNNERKNDSLDPAIVSPLTGTLIVHPALVPDLPSPPTSAATNNGQSYVLIDATGSGKFGVRAQAIVPITPLGGVPFVGALAPQCVQAKATAEYDCVTRRVRLIRIDTFICPGP
jgi:hypothetical protein